MPRRLSVLLVASLLVNVFAAGAIGGGLFMLSRQEGWRPHATGQRRPIRAAGEALSPSDRAHFRQAMRQVIEGNRDLLRTARENRTEAAQLFVQPQFDQAAVAAALNRARSADTLLRARLEAAAIDFAATLPATERAILAQGLERRGPLRHPRHIGGSADKAPRAALPKLHGAPLSYPGSPLKK